MWFQSIADTIAMQTMVQENEAVFKIAMYARAVLL